MYIERIPNRKSPPAILLRDSRREAGKVVKRTVANLSNWPADKIEALRLVLKDQYGRLNQGNFRILRSLSHGHVKAILGTIHKTGLAGILHSRRLRHRQLVIAMIAEQLIHPASKMGQVRIMPGTTLLDELGLGRVSEDELYEAMDWLYKRQPKIEQRLAETHLAKDGTDHVLYDVSSSYYEGSTCPLATFGYNRDGKKGKTIIVYGMMTNQAGCPVAVNVYPGNTADPDTVPDQAEKLRSRFGLKRVVLVGDRGMLTQTKIDHLKNYPGIGWISALPSTGVRKLMKEGSFQPTLFDQQDVAEITSDHYPGERLVVCYNPLVAEERKRKRKELLEATEVELDKISRQVKRRMKKTYSVEELSQKAGKVLDRYKMGKHFQLDIAEGHFSFQRKEDQISEEASMDGFYVVRTSEAADAIGTNDVVRQYKNLSKVESVFRTMKGVEVMVRPIRHHKEQRVKAHIFLCMLAYYVQWHMKQKLAPLLFIDEEAGENTRQRSPVAPAEPSASAMEKKMSKTTDDGLPVHSFTTLLEELGTHTRNICAAGSHDSEITFPVLSELTPIQQRAYELLEISTQ